MKRDFRPETLDLRVDVHVPPLCKGRLGGVTPKGCHPEAEAEGSRENLGSFTSFRMTSSMSPPHTPPYKGGVRSLCIFASLLLCLFFMMGNIAHASELDDARNMIQSGQLETGAQTLVRFIKANPNDSKQTPEALLLLGNTLNRLADVFSERVEMSCYWGKGAGQSLACPQAEAQKLNALYGDGAFKFVTDIAYVPYSGIHFKEILDKFPKSSQAPEGEFQILLKNLVGHPKDVLPRVKSFLDKYRDGEMNRKALLLWARVNQDVWYIHHSWSWVIYNERYSQEELLVRAEPYRQEALKTYEKLINKYPGTFEATAGKSEYDSLKANQDDGETYSILQDTIGGSPDKWGSAIPKPKLRATQRGLGEPGWKGGAPAQAPAAPAPAPTQAPQVAPAAPATKAAPPPPAEPVIKEKKETQQRWQ